MADKCCFRKIMELWNELWQRVESHINSVLSRFVNTVLPLFYNVSQTTIARGTIVKKNFPKFQLSRIWCVQHGNGFEVTNDNDFVDTFFGLQPVFDWNNIVFNHFVTELGRSLKIQVY